MKERPILFNDEMVRVILEGRKTQTRRAIKPQPYLDANNNACWNGHNFGQSADGVPHIQQLSSQLPSTKTKRVYCPFGQVGDRLWVRECFGLLGDKEKHVLHYRATHWRDGKNMGWTPSIHMPRWASRITLEITNVRVERLQDISEADAEAEGWLKRPEVSNDQQVHHDAGHDWFSDLWVSINGLESWAANPWVWVIEFKAVQP